MAHLVYLRGHFQEWVMKALLQPMVSTTSRLKTESTIGRRQHTWRKAHHWGCTFEECTLAQALPHSSFFLLDAVRWAVFLCHTLPPCHGPISHWNLPAYELKQSFPKLSSSGICDNQKSDYTAIIKRKQYEDINMKAFLIWLIHI